MYISDYHHLTLARDAERELVRDLERRRLHADGRAQSTWRERLAAWLLGIDVTALRRLAQAPVQCVAR